MLAQRTRDTQGEQRAANLAAWRARHPEIAAREDRLARQRVKAVDDFSHKRNGTAETHQHASKVRQGALARLYERGIINADQLAWANEIAMTAEGIERDVAIRTASLETRVDDEGRPVVVLLEGLMRVRREQAYTRWRKMLPMPKRMVLDMIVGEPVPFSTMARRRKMSPRQTKRLLIEAIDRWPNCMEWACKMIDRRDLALAHARLG